MTTTAPTSHRRMDTPRRYALVRDRLITRLEGTGTRILGFTATSVDLVAVLQCGCGRKFFRVAYRTGTKSSGVCIPCSRRPVEERGKPVRIPTPRVSRESRNRTREEKIRAHALNLARIGVSFEDVIQASATATKFVNRNPQNVRDRHEWAMRLRSLGLSQPKIADALGYSSHVTVGEILRRSQA